MLHKRGRVCLFATGGATSTCNINMVTLGHSHILTGSYKHGHISTWSPLVMVIYQQGHISTWSPLAMIIYQQGHPWQTRRVSQTPCLIQNPPCQSKSVSHTNRVRIIHRSSNAQCQARVERKTCIQLSYSSLVGCKVISPPLPPPYSQVQQCVVCGEGIEPKLRMSSH
jgi:hypothetical protein